MSSSSAVRAAIVHGVGLPLLLAAWALSTYVMTTPTNVLHEPGHENLTVVDLGLALTLCPLLGGLSLSYPLKQRRVVFWLVQVLTWTPPILLIFLSLLAVIVWKLGISA